MTDKKLESPRGVSEEHKTAHRGFFSLLRKNKSKESEKDAKTSKVKLSRRDILLLLTGGVAGVSIANWGNILISVGQQVLKIPARINDLLIADEYDEEVYKSMEFLKNRYLCEIEFSKVGQASLIEKKKALEIMRKKLSKYSPDILKKLKLKFIFESLYNDTPGAIVGDGIISLNTSQLSNDGCTIYHEIQHVLSEKYNVLDADWINLNPDGEKAYIDDEWEKFADVNPKKGFLEAYAMKNPSEDQAETAKILMVPLEPAMLKQCMEKDDVLAKKIEKLKEYYLEWSNGKMNAKYWEDVGNGKVNEKYWDK